MVVMASLCAVYCGIVAMTSAGISLYVLIGVKRRQEVKKYGEKDPLLDTPDTSAACDRSPLQLWSCGGAA